MIDPAAFANLRAAFPDLGEETLRHDVCDSGLALHPLVEGVRLGTLDSLERTLLALLDYHPEAPEGRGPSPARRAVLRARRKAEFVISNERTDLVLREAMREKFLWIRVWLENPPLFPSWLRLRRERLRNPRPSSEHL